MDQHTEELVDLADAVVGSSPPVVMQAAKLAIDARKWIITKLPAFLWKRTLEPQE